MERTHSIREIFLEIERHKKAFPATEKQNILVLTTYANREQAIKTISHALKIDSNWQQYIEFAGTILVVESDPFNFLNKIRSSSMYAVFIDAALYPTKEVVDAAHCSVHGTRVTFGKSVGVYKLFTG